jgi:hypothetical protein
VQRSKSVLVIVLVAVVAGNILFWGYFYVKSYQSGYDSGFLSGNQIGYELGCADGNQTGYQLGFTRGYDNGNSSGHQSGYADGYSEGNSSGYQSGYVKGYSEGNYSGYQVGFSDGNENGYDVGYLSGFYEGNQTGFDNGYLQGVEDGAGKGYTIRDPTYDEAIAFTAWDKTDENEYSENYTCHHFTADFKNNAFQTGYRCGYVYVEIVDGAHAIVCFNTTDHGIIFVEPQFDDIVILTIGQSYSDINGYELPDYNDTIVSFDIIW